MFKDRSFVLITAPQLAMNLAGGGEQGGNKSCLYLFKATEGRLFLVMTGEIYQIYDRSLSLA